MSVEGCNPTFPSYIQTMRIKLGIAKFPFRSIYDTILDNLDRSLISYEILDILIKAISSVSFLWNYFSKWWRRRGSESKKPLEVASAFREVKRWDLNSRGIDLFFCSQFILIFLSVKYRVLSNGLNNFEQIVFEF